MKGHRCTENTSYSSEKTCWARRFPCGTCQTKENWRLVLSRTIYVSLVTYSRVLCNGYCFPIHSHSMYDAVDMSIVNHMNETMSSSSKLNTWFTHSLYRTAYVLNWWFIPGPPPGSGLFYQSAIRIAVTLHKCMYSRLSIIRAWFNRFAAQPRQCIFKEKILFSVSITFV
jgi:hypothetical protein